MARYKEPDVNQYRIVTMNTADLFPDDHHLAQLLKTIRGLDLTAFDNGYHNDSKAGGRPAIPVDRMLAVIIYSLLYGNISMRNLERDLTQRADLLYLAGGLTFDHSSVSIFRKRHEKAIQNLFTQTVFVGIEAGLIDLETVCIDSTKIKANANRRDIGTTEQLAKRLDKIDEVCKKRYRQWEEAENQEEKEYLQKKIKRYEKQKSKIDTAIKFLKDNPKIKRTHMTDPDADWHKNGSNSYIIGYSAQVAVDSKSQMIVHQEVMTDQSDSNQTVHLVKAVEDIKEDKRNKKVKNKNIKYVLDCGYASEKNLENLDGFDLYLPDREFSGRLGGKIKPEDRKKDDTDILEFHYNADDDSFTCPNGEFLSYRGERKAFGRLYRNYKKAGCAKCPKRILCVGENGNRKAFGIPPENYQHTKVKRMAYHGKANRFKQPSPGGYLTGKMREKLSTREGKKIYAMRFHISEGVFGVIKNVRNGWQFLRRGKERVQIENTERSIAHNIAKLIHFARV